MPYYIAKTGIPEHRSNCISQAKLYQTELPFADATHQFKTRERDRRVPETFEAEHHVGSGLDVAMVLLDQVIEILRRSDLRVFWQQAIGLQLAYGPM